MAGPDLRYDNQFSSGWTYRPRQGEWCMGWGSKIREGPKNGWPKLRVKLSRVFKSLVEFLLASMEFYSPWLSFFLGSMSDARRDSVPWKSVWTPWCKLSVLKVTFPTESAITKEKRTLTRRRNKEEKKHLRKTAICHVHCTPGEVAHFHPWLRPEGNRFTFAND